ncbi:hypothetical protein PQR34_37840 [Paraburkholderia sediminicola]|uniref:hypothetical protein n=1 Tax=Paraburkholderia sediminicola TaxID=458836 RepID=UPI0038BBF41E
MFKKVLNAEQIQQEVHRRVLLKPPASGYPWEVSLSLPKAHAPDAEARNWDIETVGRAGYSAYVRHVVDEARKEFLLSDAAERDEIIADSFAHS